MRDYPRLDIEPFGSHLLASGDLDPVYIALKRMSWDNEQRDRWLLAYWLTYHCGFASWASEQSGPGHYLSRLYEAAYNNTLPPVGERWPRAPERRHWRGATAVNSVVYLSERHGQRPWDMVEYVSCLDVVTAKGQVMFAQVTGAAREYYGFGEWIAFKVADMLERVCDVPVRFLRENAMYESPRKAAVRLWLHRAGLSPEAKPKDTEAAITQVLDHLQREFADRPAPPGTDRRVDYQELETILCKWGSHMNGHYPLEHDLKDIRAGVEPWATVSDTAKEFLHWFPLAGQVEPPIAAAAGRG